MIFTFDQNLSNSLKEGGAQESNRNFSNTEMIQDSSIRQGCKARQHLFELRNQDNSLINKNKYHEESLGFVDSSNGAVPLQLYVQQPKEPEQNQQHSNNFQQQQNVDAINNLHSHDLKEQSNIKNVETNKIKKKFDFFGPTAPWRLLKKIELVRKFSNQLQQLSQSRRFQKLNIKHIKAINDISYIMKSETQFQKLNLPSFLKIFKKIKVFNPDALASITWDLIILIFSLLNVWLAPLQMSFEIDNDLVSQFYYISLVLYFIDIIISFNMGIYDNFTVITERVKIIQRYLNKGFLFDLIPTFFQMLYILAFNIKIFLFFQLIRAILLQSRRRKIEEHFHLVEQYPTANTLIKLLLLIFSMGHVCACGFKFVASNQDVGVTTWLNTRNVIDASWFTQYVEAMYFAFITMITVGFGDVVPISRSEKIYTIFMTLVACGVFGYTVNTIGSIFQEMAQQNAELKKQKFEVLKYMSNRQIDKNLQLKVLKYLDFMAQKEEESNVKGQEIIQMISTHLREEVLKEYFGRVLQEQKNFKNNFSNDVLEQLTVKMKEMVLGPGEILFNQGDEDRRLFFIKKGEIEFFEKNNNKKNYQWKSKVEINQIQDWTLGSINKILEKQVIMFGYTEFISGISRKLSARSVNISHVIYLNFEDFIQIIQEYPKDYEQYCMMKDFEFESNENQQCSLCNKDGHFSKDCPQVFYKPMKTLIISKGNHSVNQQRQHITRKNHKKFKIRKDLPLIKQHLKELRINLIQDVENNQNMDIGMEFFEMLANFNSVSDKEFYLSAPIYLYDDNVKQNQLEKALSQDECLTDQTNDNLDNDDGIEEADEEDELGPQPSEEFNELKSQKSKQNLDQPIIEEKKENIMIQQTTQPIQDDQESVKNNKEKLSQSLNLVVNKERSKSINEMDLMRSQQQLPTPMIKDQMQQQQNPTNVFRCQNSNDIQDKSSICDQSSDFNIVDSGQNVVNDQNGENKKDQQSTYKSQPQQSNSTIPIQSFAKIDIDDKNKEAIIDQQSQKQDQQKNSSKNLMQNDIESYDNNVARSSIRNLTNNTNRSLFGENKRNSNQLLDNKIMEKRTSIMEYRVPEKKVSNIERQLDKKTSNASVRKGSKRDLLDQFGNQIYQRKYSAKKTIALVQMNQAEQLARMLYDLLRTQSDMVAPGGGNNNDLIKSRFNQQIKAPQLPPTQFAIDHQMSTLQSTRMQSNQMSTKAYSQNNDNLTNRRTSLSKNPLLESLLPQRKGQRNSTLINENNKKLDSIQLMIENLEDTFNSKLRKIVEGDNFQKEKSMMRKQNSKTYSKLYSKFTILGETDEGFSIKGFEKQKEFIVYNPNHNLLNVIRDFRKKQLKKFPLTLKTNSKKFKNTRENFITVQSQNKC